MVVKRNSKNFRKKNIPKDILYVNDTSTALNKKYYKAIKKYLDDRKIMFNDKYINCGPECQVFYWPAVIYKMLKDKNFEIKIKNK